MRTVLNNEKSPETDLGNLNPGDAAEIIGFNPVDPEQEIFLRRLQEVGFLEGTPLEILKEAPFSHDPISIRIMGATYALRRAEANLIRVRRT